MRRGARTEHCRIDLQRVGFDQREMAIGRRLEFTQRLDGATIEFDRDDIRSPFEQQRAREAAGTGATSMTVPASRERRRGQCVA